MTSFDKLPIEIVFKSLNYIIINKPFDLIINSTDSSVDSVHKQLCALFPHLLLPSLKFGFYFPHRLDYATSGLLCIALNKKSCAAFQNSQSIKLYLGLLRGHVSLPFIQLDMPLGEVYDKEEEKNPHGNGKSIRRMSHGGTNLKKSTTRLAVLSRGLYDGYPATKVLLRPVTGRRHQLRVHMNSLGHTIVGDYTYSNGKDIKPSRMFLHAYRLIVTNNFESFDVTSDDPFIQSDLWQCIEVLHNDWSNLLLADDCQFVQV